jgi:hypothetical protein
MELCLDIPVLHNKCRRTIDLLEGMNIVAAPSNLVWTYVVELHYKHIITYLILNPQLEQMNLFTFMYEYLIYIITLSSLRFTINLWIIIHKEFPWI